MVTPFRAAALVTVPAIMMTAVIAPIVMASMATVIPVLIAPMVTVAVIALSIGADAGPHGSREKTCCGNDPGDLHIESSDPEIGHGDPIRLSTRIDPERVCRLPCR